MISINYKVTTENVNTRHIHQYAEQWVKAWQNHACTLRTEPCTTLYINNIQQLLLCTAHYNWTNGFAS